MDKLNTHVYPNGFRVIHQKPTNSLQMTVIYAYCNIGSAFEKEGIHGVSHVLEHMCFKGTRMMKNPRDIFLSYDRIGAVFNAYTEKRCTYFNVKCEDKFVENCTDILGEMMLHSIIPKSLFYREQKVILEENIRNENDNRNILNENMDAILYQGSSYAYPIDTLAYHMNKKEVYQQNKDIKYEDVLNWYHSFYIPSNVVFSIVSNLSFEHIKRILANSIYTKKIRKPIIPVFPREIQLSLQIPVSQPLIYIKKSGMSTNIISISFRTCSRTSTDRFALTILKHILNGMSGRLFTLLRGQNGYSYSSFCYTEFLEHTGVFTITTETSPEHTLPKTRKGVLSLLIQLFIDLKKKGITKEEFSVAKGNIRGNYILKTETNDTIASYNGYEFLLQESFIPFSQIYERNIEPVTMEEIYQVIQRYFITDNMVIGIIGDQLPTKTNIEKVYKQFN